MFPGLMLVCLIFSLSPAGKRSLLCLIAGSPNATHGLNSINPSETIQQVLITSGRCRTDAISYMSHSAVPGREIIFPFKVPL